VLTTNLGPLQLDNPVLSASGTFGSGWEGRQFSDLSGLGALVSKTVTVRPREGNPPPRIHETAAGMLNSIGLENKGIDHFLAEALPRMRTLGPKVIVNIGGESIDEFVQLAARCTAAGVDALELNLSCPNVQEGRLYFATEPRLTEQAVRAVKQVAGVPVFAKLSPNVTDITVIGRAAEHGGADGITAINTLIGMAVDWRRRRPVLGKTTGGLSGPAIKPVALRMVYELARSVRIPVIGVGGAATAGDVMEFLCAGASAVQLGTAAFVDPAVLARTLDELRRTVTDSGMPVRQWIGCLHRGGATAAAAAGPRPAAVHQHHGPEARK